MEQELVHKYLSGISEIAGIPLSQLEDYSKDNSPFNILEHPLLLNMTDKQSQKIEQLNTFLRTYNTLQLEESMPQGIENTAQVGKWFQSMIGNMKDHERMLMVLVDERMSPISVKTVAEGTINEAPIYPRMFLRHALSEGAAGVFVCHNHPGGSALASTPDIEVTARLAKVLEPMGITLHDHIIVTGNQYVSLREQGVMKSPLPLSFKEFQSSIDPRKTGSMQRFIEGMSQLIGVPESKLQSLAKEHGPFFLLNTPEEIPLTPKQYEKLAKVSSFQLVWEDMKSARHMEHTLGTSHLAGDYAMKHVGWKRSPSFLAVYMNSQNQVIEASDIAWRGGQLDPKMIVSRAISSDCNSMIVARNTKELNPSAMDDDRKLAHQLSNALTPMSIPLVDYLIANNTKYLSLAENGLLHSNTASASTPNLDVVMMRSNEKGLPYSKWEATEYER